MDIYKNIHEIEKAARQSMALDAFSYLLGGADDKRTVSLNSSAFQKYYLRPRRLVDVSSIDTSLSILGQSYSSPIMIAPLGIQRLFHPQGEIATANAAASLGHNMVASTVSNHAFPEIAEVFPERKPWFQLYATTNREVTKILVEKAEKAGAPVLVVTVDVPVIGNREKHAKMLTDTANGRAMTMGNLAGLTKDEDKIHDASLTWDFIAWLKERTEMKIVLKGIQTKEDTLLCLAHNVDGIIVSNHGGRQLETDRATVDCLEEVCKAANGKIPVLMDGGIRRGTDILKVLALGAKAVCIGRAFCFGLAVGGENGVSRVLEILQEELIRDMRLLGVRSLDEIKGSLIGKH